MGRKSSNIGKARLVSNISSLGRVGFLRTVWNGGIIQHKITEGGEKVALKMGYKVEGYAKDIITTKVYNRPQQGNYKRTGLARASILTELRRDKKTVFAGSDAEAFAKGAMSEFSRVYHMKRKSQKKLAQLAAVATGSSVFYLPYLEFGTRKMPPVGMLRGALDMVIHGGKTAPSSFSGITFDIFK